MPRALAELFLSVPHSCPFVFIRVHSWVSLFGHRIRRYRVDIAGFPRVFEIHEKVDPLHLLLSTLR